MEENFIGGRSWLDDDLGLRAVMLKDSDGSIEHGLWVDAMDEDIDVQSDASLVIHADGKRMEFAEQPAERELVAFGGGAAALFYRATLGDLQRIAGADTVVVQWVGTGTTVTREFDRENVARFQHWVANVVEAGPPPHRDAGVGAAACEDGVCAESRRRVRVAVPAANLRAGPGISHRVVTVLVRDVVLAVESQRGEWFEISGDDLKGFLHRFTLEELEGDTAGVVP